MVAEIKPADRQTDRQEDTQTNDYDPLYMLSPHVLCGNNV
jgi:hypothetical protein